MSSRRTTYTATASVTPLPQRLQMLLKGLPPIPTPQVPEEKINALVHDLNKHVSDLSELVNNCSDTSEHADMINMIQQTITTLATKQIENTPLNFRRDVRPIALQLLQLNQAPKLNNQAQAALAVINEMGDILDPVKILVKELDELVKAVSCKETDEYMAVQEKMKKIVKKAESYYFELTLIEDVRPMKRSLESILQGNNDINSNGIRKVIDRLYQIVPLQPPFE